MMITKLTSRLGLASLGLLLTLVGSPLSTAAAQTAEPPDLEILPDRDIRASEAFTVEIDELRPGCGLFVALGTQRGQVPFGSATLRIVPDLFVFVGLTPANGMVTLPGVAPDNISPFEGIEFLLQAVEFCLDGQARVSDVEDLEFGNGID